MVIAMEIPPREKWLVPTIVQPELAKWLNREVGEANADRVAAFTGQCIAVHRDTKIALAAAKICAQHKLATALLHGADLLTCDAHFEGLPNVAFVPKAGR
jgi:predicted nucleic acid-binding protein